MIRLDIKLKQNFGRTLDRKYPNVCWERHKILRNIRNFLAEIGVTVSSDLNKTSRSSLDKYCKEGCVPALVIASR